MTDTTYPKSIIVDEDILTFRLMEPKDRDAIVALASHLTESDLWFMRRDITQAEAVDAWLNDIAGNLTSSLLVETQHGIIAYGTLYYNQLFWNRHLGEIRVMVSSAYRNRGLGKRIASELTLIAKSLKLEKVMAYMSVEDKGAQKLFEGLNFHPEAILADWVKTRDNRTQDLLIMSRSLTEINN